MIRVLPITAQGMSLVEMKHTYWRQHKTKIILVL
jgi:hypothetical protein